MCAGKLFITPFVLSIALAHGQDLPSPGDLSLEQPDVSAELELSRQLVDQLTQDYGRLDFRLLEPLAAHADLLLNNGLFDETHDVLDRAAQIARIHEGLYTQGQFPFLLAKVRNYANRGDWLHARELMEHLHWLLTRNGNAIDENLIASLLELTDLHLRGVAEDDSENQSYHFRAALQPNRIALRVGQNAWGRFDTRLPAILYKLALQHYLQAQAVETGGRTAAALRTYTGSGITRSRSDSRQGSYYSGLRYLNEIRNIYVNQNQPELDAIALSDMYLADWQVLFAQQQAARAAYARSFDGLLQAGIEREAINQFFERPVLLPVPHLVTDWDAAALGTRPNNAAQIDAERAPSLVLVFQEWSTNIPFVHTPLDNLDESLTYDPQAESALFSFNLAGLETISRWNNGRYKTAISAAQNLEILRHSFSGVVDQEELRQQVHEIRFRPKLVNGEPQTVNATLHYQMATAH